MVSVTMNGAGDSLLAVKLQTDGWELNISASAAEFSRLRGIRDAVWETRRSLAVGTCAGAPVSWVAADEEAMILIGHDDETWDVGVRVPLATVHEIVSLAERSR